MNKSLWILLLMWVLVTALTEMNWRQTPKSATRTIVPSEQNIHPGLAYNHNSYAQPKKN